MARKHKQRQQQQAALREDDEDDGDDDAAEVAAATALLARLDLTERKLRVLLVSSIAPSSYKETPMAAVDYLLSTLTSELEAEQILSIEDVFGVIQNFVPEDLLLALAVEDEDDMEVLVSKLWSLLLKENVIPSPCEEDEEDENGWEGGRDRGCELCARVMPLTRHHLRPRATHKKLLKQGISQEELNVCAAICRPCHSALHRSHDNDTLAAFLHNVPALLEDERVGKFVRWASKQRGRAREDGHNQQLRYQR